MEDRRPYVREMVREAVEALGGQTTNVAVRDWILAHYPGTNTNTINAQISVCSVNQPGRVAFPENSKPRIAKDDRYDFLFRPARGQVELYDPAAHGLWEIAESPAGPLEVRRLEEVADDGESPTPATAPQGFAAEDHLRDYLAKNLDRVELGLEIFVDEDGRPGIEYSTPVGRIDLLAIDTNGNLVVVELKVGRTPDTVIGQALRYRGWTRQHVANGRPVRTIILAEQITDRIRYATIDLPFVELFEYELQVTVRRAAVP